MGEFKKKKIISRAVRKELPVIIRKQMEILSV